MSTSIPQSEWRWLGHKQHFCGAKHCHFSIATQVGRMVVSTIGEYMPQGSIEEIGYDRTYETMVFKVDGVEDCGCPTIASLRERVVVGYRTAQDATDGHMAMCRRVAKWRTAQHREVKA